MSLVHSGVSQVRRIRILFLVAGILNSIRLRGEVQIIPIEILAVAISFATLFSSNKLVRNSHDRQYLRFINLFCLISIAHQWFTDSMNDAVGLETLKAAAQVLVLWALLRIAVIYLQQDLLRFIYYVFGLIISIILQFLINPTVYMSAEPWKFALGPAATSLVFIVLTRVKKKTPLFFAISFLVIIDLLLGARSLALFTALTLILGLVNRNKTRRTIPNFLVILISSLILLLVIERSYFKLSTNGTFGREQQLKSLDQYSAGPLLFTARSEIPFELAAIKLNPIIGLGSNPRLNYELLNETQEINSKLGVKTQLTNSYRDAIKTGKFPGHSMILGAWVESGFVVFLLWAVILIWVLRRIYESIRNPIGPLGYYAMYMGIYTLWAILFSPLGAGSRMDLAVGLTVLLIQSKDKHIK
jgi:O-antigen ligase